MKTKKTIIAASIAALFIVPLSASAKDKWEYHDDKWNEVVVYGNVSLAEDSVQQWGPWSEFVQPAAGGPSVAFLPQTEELYRPLPQPILPTPTDFCKAGEWCGYAIYRNTESRVPNGIEALSNSGPPESRPYAGFMALMLNPDNPQYVTVDGGEGSGTVSWRAAPLPGNVAPVVANSGGPMDAYFGRRYAPSGSGHWEYDLGLSVFNAERRNTGYGEIVSKTDWVWVGDHYENHLPTENNEVAAGEFYRYISGDGGESGVIGFYVAGITTPQAYLSAQRLGDVTAFYNGTSIDISGSRIPVNLTVNFGNGTWGGSWNDGHDSWGVRKLTDSGGNSYLVGGVGFTVTNGTISGANLSASSANLAANDIDFSGTVTVTVTGKVQASFYGQTAGSVGGVTDIVKTKTVSVPDGPSLLTTITGPAAPSYTAASNVQVFVADKIVKK